MRVDGSDLTPEPETEEVREFVLDGSVTLSWAFEDEGSPYSDALLGRLPTLRAVVPQIWPLEVANALLVGERRGRLTQAQTREFVHLLDDLPILVDGETSEQAYGEILRLARDEQLSTYDAAYLELAMRRGLPLATLDRALRRAAASVGTPIFGE
jgi:predicted nucleic acid-binding protein